jgi:hypothetical protein
MIWGWLMYGLKRVPFTPELMYGLGQNPSPLSQMFSRPCGTDPFARPTQDCVLGYFQASRPRRDSSISISSRKLFGSLYARSLQLGATTGSFDGAVACPVLALVLG